MELISMEKNIIKGPHTKLKPLSVGVLILFVLVLSSCEGKMESCVDSYVDEGYSYSDAVSKCEDARDDSIQNY